MFWLVAGASAADLGDRVRAQASARDGADCATIYAAGEEEAVTAALVDVVEHVAQPPWAAIRAASCVASRPTERVQATILGWVGDPSRPGLAVVVLERLDHFSSADALIIGARALGATKAHPIAARQTRELLARSAHPGVSALVAE